MNAAQAKQATTIRRLRSKLAAATRRSNDDRQFAYKQLSIETELKNQHGRMVNMLVIALLAMNGYAPREVVYFTKTKLEDELIALYPEVAGRLGREQRHQAPATDAEKSKS